MALRLNSISISLLALCALPSLAWAAVGHVGEVGPVNVVNPQPKPSYQPPAEPVGGPLLVIRFNRHHVYYDHALKEAIDSTRQVKPGAAYRLVNTVPPGSSPSQTDRIAREAQANVQAVMQQMQMDGIAPAQITVETSTGKPGSVQEIHLFVK